MAYRCRSCGNRSAKQFPQGRCPACSSYDVQSNSTLDQQLQHRPSKKTIRDSILLVVLLACLGFGLWDGYIR
jgi:predicted ATP-dependent serine protease